MCAYELKNEDRYNRCLNPRPKFQSSIGSYLPFRFFRGDHLLLTLVAVAVFCGCSDNNKKLGRPLNAQEKRGEKLFASNCKKCHAADSGLATQGPNLEGVFDKKFLPSGAPANDERVKNVLQYGRRSMPAFGQVLDDSQIDSIIAYLKTQ